MLFHGGICWWDLKFLFGDLFLGNLILNPIGGLHFPGVYIPRDRKMKLCLAIPIEIGHFTLNIQPAGLHLPHIRARSALAHAQLRGGIHPPLRLPPQDEPEQVKT